MSRDEVQTFIWFHDAEAYALELLGAVALKVIGKRWMGSHSSNEYGVVDAEGEVVGTVTATREGWQVWPK